MVAPVQFWMVKGAGPTSAIHHSRFSAETEAERLARANPGQTFYVMEAVAAHRRVDIERVNLRPGDGYKPEGEEIPF